MKKIITLLAVAGFILALAPAAQAATVTWDGDVDDKWSTVTGGGDGFGNWDADPTTGGPHDLVLNTAGTSVLDTDTEAWTTGPRTVGVGGSHTLVLATGGVLATTAGYSSWQGTLRFDGGTIGNPFSTYLNPRIQSGGILEFHAGTFQATRDAGEDVYLQVTDGLIHVVGKTDGADFNPAYFRKANKENTLFQFSMVAGEGVETIALSSTSSAFRNDWTGTADFFALTVDGIQDYIDGGGTQSEWVLMTSAQAAPDATDDLTLVQAGLVDGGLGTVTATYDEVLLTIDIPRSGAVFMLF
jgi:hypothetical protein